MSKPNSERVRYLKYLARNGYYEKSVKCLRLIGNGEWHEFQQRVVFEISCERVKISGMEAFKLIGYNPGDNPLRIECYARLRTDQEYFPKYGTSGIPHESRSRFAKYFSKYMDAGFSKWQEKQFNIRMDKLEHDRKKARNKRIALASFKSRTSKSDKYSDQYFIMAGAAEALTKLTREQA